LPKRSIVIDVGAYLGHYTLLSVAKAACRVVAIEPHPGNYKRLLRHIRGIKASNVLAINAASLINVGELNFTCMERRPTLLFVNQVSMLMSLA
jgi:FkbM family methyltransferase